MWDGDDYTPSDVLRLLLLTKLPKAAGKHNIDICKESAVANGLNLRRWLKRQLGVDKREVTRMKIQLDCRVFSILGTARRCSRGSLYEI